MKSRACLGILLLALAGLACNLSAALTPATASPTHSPASGLRPAGSTPLSPTAPAPTTVPTATPGQPTPLPEVEFEPAGATVESELGRPRLSGVPEVLDTAHFRVHYTIKGVDAVPGADADGDGHPDYVEEVARALEYARLVQIDTLGWAPPPPDGSEGGDERYDVYLQDILVDGTAGYTDGGYAQTMVGDNPFTEAVETRSSRSFVVLDNDYAELDAWGDEEITSLALMQSTAAHEYHHALQYGYDAEEPAAWLWEAGATWMQEKVFDDINDAVAELPSVFKSPDTCQLSEGRERVESDGHWYGLWIFLQYVAEQHGADAVRAIWEQARTLDGYAAIEAALAAYGADLDGALHGFHLALLTRD
ncbi:MAG: MXAN_6640 family putative metalloprotease, partial [Anaerolineales bacterium]